MLSHPKNPPSQLGSFNCRQGAVLIVVAHHTTLEQELINEQLRHDRLFDLVKPRHWYFGHYHHSAIHNHHGCKIRQLDCGELALHTP